MQSFFQTCFYTFNQEKDHITDFDAFTLFYCEWRLSWLARFSLVKKNLPEIRLCNFFLHISCVITWPWSKSSHCSKFSNNSKFPLHTSFLINIYENIGHTSGSPRWPSCRPASSATMSSTFLKNETNFFWEQDLHACVQGSRWKVKIWKAEIWTL